MHVLLAHAAATLALVGLAWTVQVVHYPLMALVGRDGYPAYQAAHERRITPLVGLLMAVEAATAAWLVADPPGDVSRALPVVGLALVAAIWAHTRWLAVPCHARLRSGFDPAVHRRLVRTSWLRTAAWSARGAVAVALLALA